jgi:hypothetical protein
MGSGIRPPGLARLRPIPTVQFPELRATGSGPRPSGGATLHFGSDGTGSEFDEFGELRSGTVMWTSALLGIPSCAVVDH